MWNCKFGAKLGGYSRSASLRFLLITGYQLFYVFYEKILARNEFPL